MKVDTVIVGAGSAGLSALREVRRYTDDFLLVNDGHWGTTCAAVGCMPSKALIEAANAFHRRGAFEAFGIQGADGLRADMAQTAAGILRIHAARGTGRLLAAEMCAPGAEHLAQLLALAVETEMTVADMLAMPFYHPVLEEGLRSALRDLAKDVAGAGGSDLSECKAIGHDALD